MPTLRIPLAEWLPDQPDTGPGSAVITNVYPKTQNSYGPVRAPNMIYGPLTKRCQGAVAYIDKNGATTLFAGDQNDLYTIKSGDSTWENASKSAAAYNTAADHFWRFTVFNGDVIATNYADPPQAYTLVSDTDFADLPDNPPKAKFIAVVKNSFVVLANTNDGVNGISTDRLQWCAAGNHNDWPTPGTTEAAEKQAGAVYLHGPSGHITGLISGLVYADALVFQRYGVQRMTYVGPPTTFSVLPIDGSRGTSAPDSIVVLNGIAYYWGEDGIQAHDGQQNRAIGVNKVDREIYSSISQWNLFRVCGVADPKNNLIVWAYATTQSTDGNPNRLLFYSPSLDRFTKCDVSCELLVKMLTLGYTLAELETVLGYQTIAELPYPLSSDVWLGGITNLGVFSTTHRLGFLQGPVLDVTVDTPEMQGSPGVRQLITSARPLVDWTGGNERPSVAIGHRERLQDPVFWTTPAGLNAMGACPRRVSGRYVRARLAVPSSDDWTEISGVELDVVQQGRR